MGANVHDTSVGLSSTSSGTRTMAPTVALRAMGQLGWLVFELPNSQTSEDKNKGDGEFLPPLHLQIPEIGNR